MRRAPIILGVALAAAVGGLGCGGGSPSDILNPSEVDVTLTPIGEPGANSVGLELAGADGPTLSLRVQATGLESATGVAFELRYDTQILEFTGATGGAFFGTGAVAGARVVENEPGKLVGVAAAANQGEGRSGSGTLLTLAFRLKQLRDTQSGLIFGAAESLVYGPAGVAGQHSFSSAQLVTLIRSPS